MQTVERYRDNWQDEIDGAALYEAMAEYENDANRRDVYRQLAAAEREHAELWRRRLTVAGEKMPPLRPSWRTRALIALARRFGPRFILSAVAANEAADSGKYAGQADARALAEDERGHAAVLRTAAQQPGGGGAAIARAERWHRGVSSGNELRAAVLGVNDGLVSNFCLVMGVAGAGATVSSVLQAGVAGLVAGALSMALGEWLSVTNARELASSQVAREAEELEQTPQAEKHELALIYQAKGLSRDEARAIADKVMENREQALDTLVREELGIDPAELGGNPWRAAGVSLLLFALGASLPVAPFVVLQGDAALLCSVLLSLLGLAGVGLVTALFNGRGGLFSALRQVLFGGAAAAVTFGVGTLFGTALS